MTKLEGEAKFRLKSIDESKLLEWDHLQPGSKTPLRSKVLLELCRRFHEEPMNLGVQFSSVQAETSIIIFRPGWEISNKSVSSL
ncbi:MAG: hypothetical protein VXX42_12520, partial [SAR324 cluster bacterium]|nr:hypothetical protein [SAR324 cluster bacterium]